MPTDDCARWGGGVTPASSTRRWASAVVGYASRPALAGIWESSLGARPGRWLGGGFPPVPVERRGWRGSVHSADAAGRRPGELTSLRSLRWCVLLTEIVLA